MKNTRFKEQSHARLSEYRRHITHKSIDTLKEKKYLHNTQLDYLCKYSLDENLLIKLLIEDSDDLVTDIDSIVIQVNEKFETNRDAATIFTYYDRFLRHFSTETITNKSIA